MCKQEVSIYQSIQSNKHAIVRGHLYNVFQNVRGPDIRLLSGGWIDLGMALYLLDCCHLTLAAVNTCLPA